MGRQTGAPRPMVLLPGCALAILVSLVSWDGGVSWGQDPGAGGRPERIPAGRLRRDPATIASELQRGRQHLRSAIATLEGSGAPEEYQAAAAQINKGYVLVRAAHAGVRERAARANVPDPSETWESRTLQQARDHILQAQNRAKYQHVRRVDIEVAIDHLQSALQLIQRVMSRIH